MPLRGNLVIDEKAIIANHFAPLIGLSGSARGLKDDVAVWHPKPDHDLVINTDTIVAGVHFFENDPLDFVARKLLRTNLSDIIAKGAKPLGYQLSCAWSQNTNEAHIKSFVSGLRADQDRYSIELWGGDTVLTQGPLVLTATMMGVVPTSMALNRNGAKPGDYIFVGGLVGEAYLGLRILKGETFDLNEGQIADLIKHYHFPDIKPHQGEMIRDLVTASMDISDGLIVDSEAMALASKIVIELDLELMPTSQAARLTLGRGVSLIDLASGGDDYQILCSAEPKYSKLLLDAGFTKLGVCRAPVDSEKPQLIVRSGRHLIEMKKKGGYQHVWA
jgi:thiamine-monophosphate kinase